MDLGMPGHLLMGGLLALAVLIALPGALAVLRQSGISDKIDDRLQRKAGAGTTSDDEVKARPLGRAVAKLAERAAPKDEDAISKVRFRLIQAGYSNGDAVAYFFGARIAGLIVPQIGLVLALPYLETLSLPGWFPLALCAFLAFAGLAGPNIWVDRRIEARRRECFDGFPDMMDLMVACVEAGLSLDAAVIRVSEELALRYPELALQLKTIGLELRAGKSRKAAWRTFADRVGLEEAGALATMLRQSEEMGTSLGQTLRIFSKDMRQRRMLMAEEKAMALPAKMTVPLIVFVFPVLLGVLIMPAVIRFQMIM